MPLGGPPAVASRTTRTSSGDEQEGGCLGCAAEGEDLLYLSRGCFGRAGARYYCACCGQLTSITSARGEDMPATDAWIFTSVNHKGAITENLEELSATDVCESRRQCPSRRFATDWWLDEVRGNSPTRNIRNSDSATHPESGDHRTPLWLH